MIPIIKNNILQQLILKHILFVILSLGIKSVFEEFSPTSPLNTSNYFDTSYLNRDSITDDSNFRHNHNSEKWTTTSSTDNDSVSPRTLSLKTNYFGPENMPYYNSTNNTLLGPVLSVSESEATKMYRTAVQDSDLCPIPYFQFLRSMYKISFEKSNMENSYFSSHTHQLITDKLFTIDRNEIVHSLLNENENNIDGSRLNLINEYHQNVNNSGKSPIHMFTCICNDE